MKALVYEGPETLVYKDVPDPVPAEGEVLIKIAAAGICGSDMHAYLGHDDRRPAPLILGHEAAGVIVDGPQKGRRVTINPLVTSETCEYALAGRENLSPTRQIISMPPREGAFAEYVAMPERNLVTVPDHVPLEKAALAEPLAVSWHAVRLALEALHPSMERKALVIGGGAIGVAAGLALKAKGFTDVTILELNELRRDFINENCDLIAVDVVTEAYPLVVDAVGFAATRAKSSEVVSPGGVIAHIGLGEDTGGLDIRHITLQEITFIGTYTYTHQDFVETCDSLFSSSLGDLQWFESDQLSNGNACFHSIKSGFVRAPKILMKM